MRILCQNLFRLISHCFFEKQRKDKEVENTSIYYLYWHPGRAYDKTDSTSKLLQFFQDSILSADSSREAGHKDKNLQSISANSQPSSV